MKPQIAVRQGWNEERELTPKRVLADYRVITSWRLSTNTESAGSTRILLYERLSTFEAIFLLLGIAST